jgi:myo-inositol-1(or 4)-monophosphatase
MPDRRPFPPTPPDPDSPADPTSQPSPDDLTAVCAAAARAGGAVLLAGMERPKDVVAKSGKASILTWADEASQAAVFATIVERYPDHAILGEEGTGGTAGGPFTWIVDPLDGTSNYARNLPFFCVSVAVRRTGGPLVAGAVLDPLRDELFVATTGGGASLIRQGGPPQPIKVSDSADLARALVATGLQNDDEAVIGRYVERVRRLHLHGRGARSFGSPALVLAYVACGRLDAFVEHDATYPWDVAAAALLITEAGGRATNPAGGPLQLDRPEVADVLGSNGALHDDLIALVGLDESA